MAAAAITAVAAKRKEPDASSGVILPQMDGNWKRLGLIFYADHDADRFLQATQHVIGRRFIDWYNRNADSAQDDHDSECSSASGDDESDHIADKQREAECELGLHGGESMKIQISEMSRRICPEADVVLDVMYDVPYISVRLPNDRCIVLSHANSKRYELPVAEERLTGNFEHFGDVDAAIERRAYIPEARRAEYKQTLEALKCDKVAICYLYAGKSQLCNEKHWLRNPALTTPVFLVDDAASFLFLLGDVPERDKWIELWGTWKGLCSH
jgi:hypothetical protein